MIDLIITDPYQPKLRLRLLAYQPKSAPEGQLSAKVQVIENGKPIAEDPVMESWETESSIAAWIAESVASGFRFEPHDMSEIRAKDEAREAYRKQLRAKRETRLKAA